LETRSLKEKDGDALFLGNLCEESFSCIESENGVPSLLFLLRNIGPNVLKHIVRDVDATIVN